LALASYSGAQKQARDAQRKSDLSQYRNALESYAAANNGNYPPLAYPNPIDNICGEGKPLDSHFITSCPDDPLLNQDYFYASSNDQKRYILYADLETGGYWYICSTGKTGIKDGNPTITDCL